MKERLNEYRPWIQCWKYLRNTQKQEVISLLSWTMGWCNFNLTMVQNMNLLGDMFLYPEVIDTIQISDVHTAFYFNDDALELLDEILLNTNYYSQRQAMEDVKYLIREVLKIETPDNFNTGIYRFMAVHALQKLTWHLPV